MSASQLYYLPLAFPFFSILLFIFFLLFLLVEIGVLRYAYMRLGVSSRMALLLLAGSLIGSYFNIPVAELPGRQIEVGREITYFGMRWVTPMLVNWPGTIIAVNVGGALIPASMSIYLLLRHRLLIRGSLAVAIVAALCNSVAQPVPGLGIAIPLFFPALFAALVAFVLSWRHAASLAYIGGCLGVLIGADLLNLNKIQGLGASVASIGGAGTFDGVFLTGVIAVLIAAIAPREQPSPPRPQTQHPFA